VKGDTRLFVSNEFEGKDADCLQTGRARHDPCLS